MNVTSETGLDVLVGRSQGIRHAGDAEAGDALSIEHRSAYNTAPTHKADDGDVYDWSTSTWRSGPRPASGAQTETGGCAGVAAAAAASRAAAGTEAQATGKEDSATSRPEARTQAAEDEEGAVAQLTSRGDMYWQTS